MASHSIPISAVLACLAGLPWTAVLPAADSPPFELISEAEAKREDEPSRDTSRSIFPGPRICPVSLRHLRTVGFPVRFTLALKAYGGADIPSDSFNIQYWKRPKVDLYPRLRDHGAIEKIQNGYKIKINDAVIPIGTHTLFVQAVDTRGQEHARFFTLKAELLEDAKSWSLEPESGSAIASCESASD